ncbi:unnamed protein product [Paramecium sonneborni]|uniref:Uncharacterized protein n=1 Tax=Paramecium sonneborni TaxID=65129 RepID=A0A8S1MC17_9CILI|nr:unnamed protein product [Paramecium sonneborni]
MQLLLNQKFQNQRNNILVIDPENLSQEYIYISHCIRQYIQSIKYISYQGQLQNLIMFYNKGCDQRRIIKIIAMENIYFIISIIIRIQNISDFLLNKT